MLKCLKVDLIVNSIIYLLDNLFISNFIPAGQSHDFGKDSFHFFINNKLKHNNNKSLDKQCIATTVKLHDSELFW